MRFDARPRNIVRGTAAEIVMTNMPLTSIEESLLLAAYFRGGSQDEHAWGSNTDQILTLSLFYTGDISFADCEGRFSIRSYIQDLYDDDGELTEEIEARYRILINLLQEHAELIEGAGNFQFPAHPTYTSCRLTDSGSELALTLLQSFPQKPEFLNWPDKRSTP